MQDASVLFVCLGNICRSPTAHGVFKKMVMDRGLQHHISIESAGTSGWHITETPDVRATAAALERGYDISKLRGRQVMPNDFFDYDFILAMDRDNLYDLQQMRPMQYEGYLGLLLEFSQQRDFEEVPDPYYGGGNGFELVLDLVEDACRGLLEYIIQKHR